MVTMNCLENPLCEFLMEWIWTKCPEFHKLYVKQNLVDLPRITY